MIHVIFELWKEVKKMNISIISIVKRINGPKQMRKKINLSRYDVRFFLEQNKRTNLLRDSCIWHIHWLIVEHEYISWWRWNPILSHVWNSFKDLLCIYEKHCCHLCWRKVNYSMMNLNMKPTVLLVIFVSYSFFTVDKLFYSLILIMIKLTLYVCSPFRSLLFIKNIMTIALNKRLYQ